MHDQGAWNRSKTYHVGQDLGYFQEALSLYNYTSKDMPYCIKYVWEHTISLCRSCKKLRLKLGVNI